MGFFLCRLAEGNLIVPRLITLLLPNTSVLVTRQTMVHEDRETYSFRQATREISVT